MSENAYVDEFLNRDRVQYVDMRNALKSGKASMFYADKHGVILMLKKDNIAMLAADSAEFVKAHIDILEKYDGIIAHSMETAEFLRDHFNIDEKYFECCMQMAYFGGPIEIDRPNLEIKRLHMKDLDYVHKHYHRVEELDYIKYRLRAGMYGAYYCGELAGFIGTHSDGSIGFLEVLPEYRRKGIGSALEAFMFNKYLSKGLTPYGQVVMGNEGSVQLQKHMNCVAAPDIVAWLFPEV